MLGAAGHQAACDHTRRRRCGARSCSPLRDCFGRGPRPVRRSRTGRGHRARGMACMRGWRARAGRPGVQESACDNGRHAHPVLQQGCASGCASDCASGSPSDQVLPAGTSFLLAVWQCSNCCIADLQAAVLVAAALLSDGCSSNTSLHTVSYCRSAPLQSATPALVQPKLAWQPPFCGPLVQPMDWLLPPLQRSAAVQSAATIALQGVRAQSAGGPPAGMLHKC